MQVTDDGRRGVIEITCFTGRGPAACRALAPARDSDRAAALGLPDDDLGLVIRRSPPADRGSRGRAGDELDPPYRGDVRPGRRAPQGPVGWAARMSWPGGRVEPEGSPRNVRAPQGRVVGNTHPG